MKLMLRLAQGSLFWVEFIRTDLVGVKKHLVSFSDSFSNSSLVFSFVLGFNSFRSSLWDSARRILISDVISSFEEALKPSMALFSIPGDFAAERLRPLHPGLPELRSPSKLVKLNLQLQYRCSPDVRSFSFGF